MKRDLDPLLPNFQEPELPIEQLIDFVDREIKRRRKNAPFLIERGSLKSQTAWKAINMFEAVRKRLESIKT